jgi:hypothetical protein
MESDPKQLTHVIALALMSILALGVLAVTSASASASLFAP